LRPALDFFGDADFAGAVFFLVAFLTGFLGLVAFFAIFAASFFVSGDNLKLALTCTNLPLFTPPLSAFRRKWLFRFSE